VVGKEGPAPSVSELRGFVRERLPEYMVPSAFMVLEALPLTPNGKVDRQALPAPDGTRPELDAAHVMPQNELERTIAAVWQSVLGMTKVGIHDNFFELGGHSLMLARVHSQLQEIFSRDFSLVELYRYPTISTLAEYFTHEPGQQPSFQQSHARAEKQKEAIKRQKPKVSRVRGRLVR
jgi:acyl carrier protein